MDQEANPNQTPGEEHDRTGVHAGGRASRRQFLKYGAWGLGALGAGAAVVYCARQTDSLASAAGSTDVFKHDAPQGEVWQGWQDRGWVREARHYLKLGANVQCRLCPNQCLLEPEDRGRCRDRVNKDGTLYTLAYGNACAFHVDPVEKKPLYHFLPATNVFSLAAAGCGFRCLNCQNWDISQRRPEETKSAQGDSIRLNPETLGTLSQMDIARVSLFPEDIIALCEHFQSPSVAYTYSEPSVWFEYMIDTARLARRHGIKNVWVTCGYIQKKPLLELCQYLDAANVDLKSFDPDVYGKLNSGKLEPILETLQTLKREGVWFEVTNLVVPTYTDRLGTIRQMCLWLVDHLGPDYPLHFSRFHPAHKLTYLPPTPVDVLTEAREIARQCGLRYVYIGNVYGVEDVGNTSCPKCGRTVIRRDIYYVAPPELDAGKCPSCGTPIAGVWSA